MVRPKRLKSKEAYYHICSRGVRKLPIFLTKEDFLKVFFIFEDAHKKYNFEICDFAIMHNHYHFLIRTFGEKNEISKLMQYVNSRLAKSFNSSYGLSGHVFEEVFFSRIIYQKEDLLKLIRYIERNPVKAKLVKACEHWDWTFSNFLLTKKYQFGFLSVSLIKDLFQETINPIKEFLEYINFSDPEDDIYDPMDISKFLKYKVDLFLQKEKFEDQDDNLFTKIFLYREILGMSLVDIADEVSNKGYAAIRKMYSRILRNGSRYKNLAFSRANKLQKSIKYIK